MTIGLTVYEHYYDGDGSTLGPHTISFAFFSTADVIVEVGGVLKTLATHYTITPGSLVDGHYAGGTLNFTSGNAPADDTDNIYIACNTPATQSLDMATINTFDPSQVERVLDRNVMVARDAYAKAARANVVALDDLIVLYQDYVDAAEAAAAAAAASEAAAAASASDANSDATSAGSYASAADASADAAAASALAAQNSAASASAIANQGLFGFANTTGNFTAIGEAAYYVDDGAQITLPAIGVNVQFRIYCKTQPPATGVTFLYSGGHAIQGVSGDVLIKNTGVINCFSTDGSTWSLTKGSMALLSSAGDTAVRAITGNSTMLVTDGTVVATLTSGNATLSLHDPAASFKVHKVKNAASSTGNLAIGRYASELIEGQAAPLEWVFPGQAISIQSDGTNWIIVG